MWQIKMKFFKFQNLMIFTKQKENIVIQYYFYFYFPHFDEILDQIFILKGHVDIIILLVLRKVVCLFVCFCFVILRSPKPQHPFHS
jgi:hypothetical protein